MPEQERQFAAIMFTDIVGYTALLMVLVVGFPISLYLAWNYEHSPQGFVKSGSQQSWQNP